MYLTINGKDYEARTDFKFQRVADDKYSQKDKDGKKVQDGFQTIYTGLLEYDPTALSHFWDCALSHLKEKPSLDAIDNALLEAAGEEQNFDPLFQDAFSRLDESGFFRQKVKTFWKHTEMAQAYMEDDKEKEAFKGMLEEMKLNRQNLSKK